MDHQPPTGVLRLAARVPIWLYHAGAGWILGDRFLMLNHIGRKSGLLRQVVVEVVYHDKIHDVYYIASGWGEKANWYQNIQANPHVTIQVGAHKSKRTAKQLPTDEAQAVFWKYAQQHPHTFEMLSRFMLGVTLPATVESCHRLAEKVPLIALYPKAKSVSAAA